MTSSITSEPNFQAPDEKNSEISINNPQMPVASYAGFDYRKLFEKLGKDTMPVFRIDYYGNAIPLGAFCNAVAFIIYGFYRCNVFRVNDTFLWAIILLFGGLGQLTAGFLEFAKGRTFPSTIYLSYGSYCLSHYALYIIPKNFRLNDNMSMQYDYEPSTLCAYYSAWVVISFGIALASARINILFILQNLLTLAFFLVRAIGEGSDTQGCKRNAAGILEVIAGGFSLLVFLSQILNNETFHSAVIPAFPMSPNTNIDVVSPSS